MSDEDDTCSQLHPPVNTITSHIQLSIIKAGTCSAVNSFTLLAPCEALTFQPEHCRATDLFRVTQQRWRDIQYLPMIIL